MGTTSFIKRAALGALAAAALAPAFAQDAPVRIGYAISRTGPWSAGAQVTQEPNYIMWAEQVNARGALPGAIQVALFAKQLGILQGKRRQSGARGGVHGNPHWGSDGHSNARSRRLA